MRYKRCQNHIHLNSKNNVLINYAKNKINSFCVSEEKEDEASRNGNINQNYS